MNLKVDLRVFRYSEVLRLAIIDRLSESLAARGCVVLSLLLRLLLIWHLIGTKVEVWLLRSGRDLSLLLKETGFRIIDLFLLFVLFV